MKNRRYIITVTIHDNYINDEKSTVFCADEFRDSINTSSTSYGSADFYVQETEVSLQMTNYQKKSEGLTHE